MEQIIQSYLGRSYRSVLNEARRILTVLTVMENCRLFEGFCPSHQKPPGFSIPNLAKEVLLSYSLIFHYDSSARRTCRDLARRMTVEGSYIDPLMKELSSEPRATFFRKLLRYSFQPVKESFDVSADFPILGSRLLRIQSHIDGIQPNRVTSLWRDKRDILRWYTFWAVLILGGLNLLIATVQIAATTLKEQRGETQDL